MAGPIYAETNPWIGRAVSGVRIERLLGRGGMAEVFLGPHLDAAPNIVRCID